MALKAPNQPPTFARTLGIHGSPRRNTEITGLFIFHGIDWITATDQLVEAIRRILGGGKHISERVADLLITYLSNSTDGAIHEKLSDREFQILCLFGEGKTIKQIAAVLCLSSQTVSTYRDRILDKMEMKTTAELVRYAIQNKLSRG